MLQLLQSFPRMFSAGGVAREGGSDRLRPCLAMVSFCEGFAKDFGDPLR